MCILWAFFDRDGRYLDFAGGLGILVRMMRDVGFDFRWDDRYAANVVAAGFTAAPDERDFEAITAIEAMEHVVDPLTQVSDLLDRSRTQTLIFTQELFESPAPSEDWWYFNFPVGQHVSFYSRKTLRRIAQQFSVNYYTCGGLHIFTARKLPRWKLSLVDKAIRTGLPFVVGRMVNTRTASDHAEVLSSLDQVAE